MLNFISSKKHRVMPVFMIIFGMVTSSILSMNNNQPINQDDLRNLQQQLDEIKRTTAVTEDLTNRMHENIRNELADTLKQAYAAKTQADLSFRLSQEANNVVQRAGEVVESRLEVKALELGKKLDAAAIESVTRASEQINNQLHTRVNQAEQNIGQAAEAFNQMVQRMQQIEQTAVTNAQQAQQAHAEHLRIHQANQTVLGQLRQRIETIEQAAVNNTQQVNQAQQQELDQLRLQIQQIEQAVATNVQQAQQANAQHLQAHQNNQTVLDQLRQQVEQMEQAALNTAQQLNTSQQQAQQAQQELNQLRTQLAQMQQVLDHTNQQQANLQAKVDTKRDHVREMLESFGQGAYNLAHDPKRMATIACIITILIAGMYAAKYGIPLLVDNLLQPRVVCETSRKSWFGWKAPTETININDLTFKPELQKQLLDLALRVKTAKEFDESLPNALFFGAPGTGKTAFAKALSYWSGLDYALTSGSEFAKIKDINLQNKELRKLIEWGKTSDKGLIIFIDEAESLFANSMLTTTSNDTKEFIKTFLELVPKSAQKKIIFIFATNHPFKLNSKLRSRIDTNIAFTLPEQPERIKILDSYLQKFAEENEEALVQLPAATLKHLPEYAQELDGFAPRAIKFVAEEMIVRARRNNENPHLSKTIAHEVIHEAKIMFEQTKQWEVERERWVTTQQNIETLMTPKIATTA